MNQNQHQFRGPGPILVPADATKIRQQASQIHNVAKKRKVVLDASGSAGKCEVTLLTRLGGQGSVQAFCNVGRHRQGKRGKHMPPQNEVHLQHKFGTAQQPILEAQFQVAAPKFVPTNNPAEQGVNLSPGMGAEKAAKSGLKSALRIGIGPIQGRSMATHGVNFRNFIIGELTSNAAHGAAPPTEDEILAAMQLSILDSRTNAALPAISRTRVSKCLYP